MLFQNRTGHKYEISVQPWTLWPEEGKSGVLTETGLEITSLRSVLLSLVDFAMCMGFL